MEFINTERGLVLDVTVNLPHGLHSRPSAKLAQKAREFDSDIHIIGETAEVDAKSMLDILSLASPYKTRLRLLANGPDSREALTALYDLVSNYRQENGQGDS